MSVPVASAIIDSESVISVDMDSLVTSVKALDSADLFKLLKATLAEAEKKAKAGGKGGKAKATKKAGSAPKGVIPSQLKKPRAWVEYTLKDAIENGWESFTVHQTKKDKEDDDGDKKEIDFKEKALNAKEQALKKVTHNATKNQGGGGGDGPNSQKKSGNFTKFTKTIRAIAANALLPCVVFCFSKQQTIDVPMALDEKLDFTDGTEKGKIKAFLK